MTIICNFENIQKMTQAVAESANAVEKQPYTLRPWNRFEPADTIWWLVPSTEWPAYAHGKGIISPGGLLTTEQVFCGLHVEKAFGPMVAEAFPELRARKLITGPHWTWTKFLEGLTDGSFAQAAGTVGQNTGEPVVMAVAASYPGDPSDFNPYDLPGAGEDLGDCRSSIDGGQVWFAVEGERLEQSATYCLQDSTRPVVGCQSLGDLADVFRGSDHLAWCWLDVSVGTMVWLEQDAPESGQRWDANDIWDKAIRPWRAWIV